MSHNSVESMRDIAFRKGRNGFSSDDDYLRALRGEELEDELLDEDEEDEPLNDEEDEPLDDEEDEPLDDEYDYDAIAEFEDAICYVIAEAPNRMVNAMFDWIMKAEAGDCPGKLTFAYSGTTMKMRVAGEDLEFEVTGNGADSRGRYDFESFLVDIQDMLMDEVAPYCTICDVVKDCLDTAHQYGYADVWKEDIAKFMADRGKVSTDRESSLDLCADKPGKGTNMHIRFVRRPLLQNGDTLWVLPNLASLDTTLKEAVLEDRDGHPTKLLQWLFGRNGLIDILRPE